MTKREALKKANAFLLKSGCTNSCKNTKYCKEPNILKGQKIWITFEYD